MHVRVCSESPGTDGTGQWCGRTLVERALRRAFPAARLEEGLEPCAERPLFLPFAAPRKFSGQTFGTHTRKNTYAPSEKFPVGLGTPADCRPSAGSLHMRDVSLAKRVLHSQFSRCRAVGLEVIEDRWECVGQCKSPRNARFVFAFLPEFPAI